jgi:uncharacterized membrane protein
VSSSWVVLAVVVVIAAIAGIVIAVILARSPSAPRLKDRRLRLAMVAFCVAAMIGGGWLILR